MKLGKHSIISILFAGILFFSAGAETSSYAEEKMLCPLGNTVGITVELSGVCVVSLTPFEAKDGDVISPAEKAGIRTEDIIAEINGELIDDAAEMEEIIKNSSGRAMKLKVMRCGKAIELELSAKQSIADNEYHIGAWIRDSSSGIGTMTFYDKQTGKFGALGHGVCDEMGEIIDVKRGKIHHSKVTSVQKGEKGIPGELIAVFEDDGVEIGEICANTSCGVYGKTDDDFEPMSVYTELPVASREEVQEGEATILSNIEGEKVEEYSAEIIKINKDLSDTRCMIIKITDSRLSDKTGGIIRGMSGSPIVQNGKLVGAVTHVFVNDPTRGYGIFIENMLAEAEKIK